MGFAFASAAAGFFTGVPLFMPGDFATFDGFAAVILAAADSAIFGFADLADVKVTLGLEKILATGLAVFLTSAVFFFFAEASSFLPLLSVAANLKEALTLINLPASTSFLIWTARIFLQLGGRCDLCFSSVYLAMALGLEPPFSFS